MSRSDKGVTIQINSLAALERLLGDDPESFVSIRDAVAAQFAGDHLRRKVEEVFALKLATFQEKINQEVEAYALEKLQNSPSWNPQLVLTPAVVTKIKAEVQVKVGELINAEVERHRAIIKETLDAEIAKLVASIPQTINTRITATFNREVSAAVDARLREIKSLLPADPPESRKITIA